MAGPLDLTGISTKFNQVLAGLGVFEPHYATVTLDKHHAGARFDFLS